jgi:hypothetical protein
MNRGNTQAALDTIRPAMSIELGNLCGLWCTYVHGNILLKGKMANEAAADFKKIIDHRFVEPLSPAYPLAFLGLGRAAALGGDMATARTAYQNFFATWKDADQDLPVLIEAKKEYDQIK